MICTAYSTANVMSWYRQIPVCFCVWLIGNANAYPIGKRQKASFLIGGYICWIFFLSSGRFMRKIFVHAKCLEADQQLTTQVSHWLNTTTCICGYIFTDVNLLCCSQNITKKYRNINVWN